MSWATRQPITIQTYNVEPHVPKWKANLSELAAQNVDMKHTIGTWFRLFAHNVLRTDVVQRAIYMDTDAVVMSNVEELWDHVRYDDPNNRNLFFLGESECAGFMVFNIEKLPQLWDEVSKLDLQAISKQLDHPVNDQLVVRAVYLSYPDLVGVLPQEWDINIADGAWRLKSKFVYERPRVGMIHFNGGGGSKDAYYESHDFVKAPELRKTYGIADYYSRMPWPWAKHIVESKIQRATTNNGGWGASQNTTNGYPMTILHRNISNVENVDDSLPSSLNNV
jgi:hypothetical protein